MLRRMVYLFAIGVAAAACSDASGPEDDEVVETEDLQFVRFDAEALAAADKQGSVWAVKGRTRELVLRYAPEPGEEEGEEFLEFDIPGDALLSAPNGTLYEEGDSVLITVQVDDAGRFLFTFEPSGLTFDPDHAPELEVTYRRAEGDIDGDGDDDEDDDELEARLQLWQQEAPGDPWKSVGSVRLDEDEIEAKIRSFTGFALAS